MEELCKNDYLKSAIMADIKKISKDAGLHGFETPKEIYIEHNMFSPENDLVTPTFKVKRDKLRVFYEKQISGMYASLPPQPSKL